MTGRFTFTDETANALPCTFAGRRHYPHEWANGAASCLYCGRLLHGELPQMERGESVIGALSSAWGKPKPDAV